jgi:hypothetical protein
VVFFWQCGIVLPVLDCSDNVGLLWQCGIVLTVWYYSDSVVLFWECLVYPILPVSLYYTFLIAPSVFSDVYLLCDENCMLCQGCIDNVHVYACMGCLFCLCFYDCFIWFWDCSDSVGLFWQCGIVLTVWYCWQSGERSCSWLGKSTSIKRGGIKKNWKISQRWTEAVSRSFIAWYSYHN